MKTIRTLGILLFISAILLSMVGCAPEVGSQAWCQQMKEKDKGDWSANDAADYAKHCLFK